MSGAKELNQEEIQEQIEQTEKTLADPGVTGMHRMILLDELKRLKRIMVGFTDSFGLDGKIAQDGLDKLSEEEFQKVLSGAEWSCADLVEQLDLGQQIKTDWQADLRCLEWASQEAKRQAEPRSECKWVLILYNPSDLLMQRLSMLTRGSAFSDSGGWEDQPHNIWVVVISCELCKPPLHISFIGCPSHIQSGD